jgi:hypothetical protein
VGLAPSAGAGLLWAGDARICYFGGTENGTSGRVFAPVGASGGEAGAGSKHRGGLASAHRRFSEVTSALPLPPEPLSALVHSAQASPAQWCQRRRVVSAAPRGGPRSVRGPRSLPLTAAAGGAGHACVSQGPCRRCWAGRTQADARMRPSLASEKRLLPPCGTQAAAPPNRLNQHSQRRCSLDRPLSPVLGLGSCNCPAEVYVSGVGGVGEEPW